MRGGRGGRGGGNHSGASLHPACQHHCVHSCVHACVRACACMCVPRVCVFCGAENGVLYTCGSGQNGQLGQGATEDSVLFRLVVGITAGSAVASVSVGDSHMAAITGASSPACVCGGGGGKGWFGRGHPPWIPNP